MWACITRRSRKEKLVRRRSKRSPWGPFSFDYPRRSSECSCTEEELDSRYNMFIYKKKKKDTRQISIPPFFFLGMMSRLIEITKIGFSKIDETCSIRERTSNLTNAGIAKAIEMDRYYEVHQFFAEVFYTGCTAILKAGIAYAEYDQTAEGKEQENNTQVA